MKPFDEVDLRWQRLLPIMIFLTLISYLSGRILIAEKIIAPKNTCEFIFEKVDKAPSYIGGDQSFLVYNQQKILPIIVRILGSQARMITQLKYEITISQNGEVVDCHIKTELPENLKSKIKSEIFKMPKWEPAVKDGKSVCFKIKIPIRHISWE